MTPCTKTSLQILHINIKLHCIFRNFLLNDVQEEGLNSVIYNIRNVTQYQLYTWICVDLPDVSYINENSNV